MKNIDELLGVAKLSELMSNDKKDESKKVLWVLAIIGAVAAVAGIAALVYKYLSPDYLEDIDDDYDDEEDDDEEEDDYYLDDDFEEEAPRKGLFSKKNTEYDDEEEQDKPRFLGRSNPKVVPMRRSMEVTMIKPTSMEDSRDICDYLLAGKAVVLNMEGIHTEVAQRIIDFTSGATYSMNGNLQKISNYIFIATPDSVELSGDFQDILAAGGAMGMDVSGLNIHL